MIYIAMPRARVDERAFQAIRRLRACYLDGKGSALPELTTLSLAEFKTLVRRAILYAGLQLEGSGCGHSGSARRSNGATLKRTTFESTGRPTEGVRRRRTAERRPTGAKSGRRSAMGRTRPIGGEPGSCASAAFGAITTFRAASSRTGPAKVSLTFYFSFRLDAGFCEQLREDIRLVSHSRCAK